MRPITKEARCAYQVHANPAAITRGHHPRAARGHHAAHRARVPLDQRGAAAPRGARGADRRGRGVPDRAAGAGAAADGRGDRQAAGRGAVPGADVRRRRLARGRAGARRCGWPRRSRRRCSRAGRSSPNFPTRHPLYCGMYPVSKDFEKATGLKPDLIFLVGLPGRARQRERAGRHADRAEPAADGPALPARPRRAVRAARDARGHHRRRSARVHGADKAAGVGHASAPRCARTRRLLIEREENLVREHEHDSPVHPAVLEAHLAEHPAARTR